jgi:hypothetical protein
MRAHHDDDKSTGLVPAALLAVVVALVGLAGAVKMARTVVELGPAVGDIVQFDPHHFMPVDAHTQIAAQRINAGDCVLDLGAIHRGGGSLIVEQRYVNGGDSRYRVHWAGRESAVGSADCGREADLMLGNTNLDLLAMAAGGWGVEHKQVLASGS